MATMSTNHSIEAIHSLRFMRGGIPEELSWSRRFLTRGRLPPGRVVLKAGYPTVANGWADDITFESGEECIVRLSRGGPSSFARFAAGTTDALIAAGLLARDEIDC